MMKIVASLALVASAHAFGGQGKTTGCVYNPKGGMGMCRGFCGNSKATSAATCAVGGMNARCCMWKAKGSKPTAGAGMCKDATGGPVSTYGTCATYKSSNWCTAAGAPGSGWQKSWGKLGVKAKKYCCACGGGHKYHTGGKPQHNASAHGVTIVKHMMCATNHRASKLRLASKSQAMSRCHKMANCTGIYDVGCHGKAQGAYYLCASESARGATPGPTKMTLPSGPVKLDGPAGPVKMDGGMMVMGRRLQAGKPPAMHMHPGLTSSASGCVYVMHKKPHSGAGPTVSVGTPGGVTTMDGMVKQPVMMDGGMMVKPPMKVDGGMNMVKVGNCATGPC